MSMDKIMPPKRKIQRNHNGVMRRKCKTKKRTKDLDEVNEDLKLTKAMKLLNQEVDLDIPGGAQYYCIHCSRYFIDGQALKAHFHSKRHKNRLKSLELEPYTIEESLRAAGMGCYVYPEKRLIQTLTKDDFTSNERVSSTKL